MTYAAPYTVFSGTSSVRRPVIATLGSYINVASPRTDFNPPPSVNLSLTSDQKTALGWTDTVEDLAGLTWITGAKLQTSPDNLLLVDPAACAALVDARIDSDGRFTLYLCPSMRYSTGDDFTALPYSIVYPGQSGTPYIAAGLWYLYIQFFLSPYLWQA